MVLGTYGINNNKNLTLDWLKEFPDKINDITLTDNIYNEIKITEWIIKKSYDPNCIFGYYCIRSRLLEDHDISNSIEGPKLSFKEFYS